jgi:hypothetical protein
MRPPAGRAKQHGPKLRIHQAAARCCLAAAEPLPQLPSRLQLLVCAPAAAFLLNASLLSGAFTAPAARVLAGQPRPQGPYPLT